MKQDDRKTLFVAVVLVPNGQRRCLNGLCLRAHTRLCESFANSCKTINQSSASHARRFKKRSATLRHRVLRRIVYIWFLARCVYYLQAPRTQVHLLVQPHTAVLARRLC